MRMTDTYALPADYQPNSVTTTMDHVSGQAYWTARRIALSRYYQHAVYELARDIAVARQAKTIMDVGCGTGMKLALLHKALPSAQM